MRSHRPLSFNSKYTGWGLHQKSMELFELRVTEMTEIASKKFPIHLLRVKFLNSLIRL
jgi:hypothetical protein